MKKYQKGKPIKSLDELVSQEFIYWNNKITHKGWFLSWQIGMTLNSIQSGNTIFKAVKMEDLK